MTDKEKQELYRLGKYAFPAPPVGWTKWDMESWIKYIDAHGKWLINK